MRHYYVIYDVLDIFWQNKLYLKFLKKNLKNEDARDKSSF